MYKNNLVKVSPSEGVRIARRTQINRATVQGIIPPHMLKELAQRGDQKQRERAFQALTLSERIRERREVLGPLATAVATPAGEKRRTVYDVKNECCDPHSPCLPGSLVREEGDPSKGDPSVDEAYDGAGATYDLYREIFERNSIDDRGMRIDSTVHFCQDYNNAFFNGTQMVYGDGDVDIFEPFTRAIDVIGHELTHGVTQYEANLLYAFQSGALNESMSDVFGSLVKQRKLNQTADEADWLIGEGLFTSKVNGKALRSMKEPGTAYDDPKLGRDPQPAHMRDVKRLPFWEDNGGVHINSGIPNRAFCITAMEIGGFAWERAGRIWYIALRDRLRRFSNFQDAANKTFLVAGELFGAGSEEQKAVRKGWTDAGINITVRAMEAIPAR
ncbi:Zinc metalloprotease (elastase) [Candidatus Methanoperedens nitroreducens]|uniref:Zinc metalloprotease (Elastase) n=1 Tax=Candidatus Methanoperedens nitratireducens TaxID=1392998 RepID=A0A062V2T6_9EURY|nr:M4 family metallopeptidase [Candidatus Methanoperedens nitroreducens]KCZ73391.1 Zinc metalloprotease (elastase) [Candidatus Methanoperedens nitroreducens]MDJ1422655.1 M4 family metallopeptidase [Candidatus Methanoperedens sp.]